MDGGHILYTVLLDDDVLGTGILLHAKHVKSSNVVHRVCSRVLGLDLRVNGIKYVQLLFMFLAVDTI